MGVRSCFVPGCSTGYSSTCRKNRILGVKNRSLFKANSESQLRKWRMAIPRKDKVLGNDDCVCELHFESEDVIRFYETVMPDGSVHKLERGKPLLKRDAIPKIFPVTKNNRKKKEPIDRKISQLLSPKIEKRDSPSIYPSKCDNLALLAEVAIATITTFDSVP